MVHFDPLRGVQLDRISGKGNPLARARSWATEMRNTICRDPRKAPQHTGLSSHSLLLSLSISLPLPLPFPCGSLSLGLSDFVEQACCWTMSLKPWLPPRATARPSSFLIHHVVIIIRLPLCVLRAPETAHQSRTSAVPRAKPRKEFVFLQCGHEAHWLL